MTEFIKRSPLAIAKEYANLELKNESDAKQLRWLHSNPILWLRALSLIQKDAEGHSAKERRNLVVLKPKTYTHASEEYLRAKAEFDERSINRLHFLQKLHEKREFVKAIIGDEGILAKMMVGDILEMLCNLKGFVEDDDMEALQDSLNHWIKVVRDANNSSNA